MIKILFLILLGLGVSAVDYSFNTEYTCITDGNTRCSEWKLSLNFYQNIGACFPAIQKVVTLQGIKTMNELKIGDQLLGYNYKTGPTYSPLRSWLHKLEGSKYQYQYQNIQTKSGNLYISAMHNIGIRDQNGHLGFVFAQDIDEKSHLFGNNEDIVANSLSIQQGVYAPLTQLFNFYLVISEQEKIMVLVHCFAHISNPVFYQNIYYYAENLMNLMGLDTKQLDENGISSFNVLLMSLFPEQFVKSPKFHKIQIKDRLLETTTTYNSNNDDNGFQTQLLTITTYFSTIKIAQLSV